MNQIKSLIFLLVISLPFVVGFQKKEPLTFQQKVDKQLNEKLRVYKKQAYDKCRKKVMDKAIIIVDSTMIADAKNLKTVREDKPGKPVKPAKPTILVPNDSSAVAPIFESEN